ncbi:MAG: aminoglycoside 6-adenylyltransferase [Chloroflexi bacterium]|nr:aminoglycoside 6-adenylyltransferase [Chloroflexota bacterium]
MRSEQEMYELIVNNAQKDDRVRAVIMNGSRANPNAPHDIFQDFDIVYIVTEVSPFKNDSNWVKQFGEMMIMQMPDEMQDTPPSEEDRFAYLMQFADGNRIDLTLYPIAKLNELGQDSLSLLLLDKDGIIELFAPPSESDYLPKPPTPKEYADCCNEFWWVCTYVVKGLWREEILYAKCMFDQIVREQLMKMLTWHIGVTTQFSQNPGKMGKYFKRYLAPDLWETLQKTYADANYDNSWEALYKMCELFRTTAVSVAEHFGFDYPNGDDERVSAHLKHVQFLPKNAIKMY